MAKIEIFQIAQSTRSKYDFNNLPFGRVFTDHMFMADYDGEAWTNFQIKPVEKLAIHPGNITLHYGQSIFEGMKASKHKDGTPLLLRPEMHIARLNASARRMCIPEFPADVFHEALHLLVDLEKEWIPQTEGSALYIRPFIFGADEFLGVRPSTTYKMIINTLPVGKYYSKPVSLRAEQTYVRASEGGVGEAKTSGNYAASLYPAKLAKEAGYDQVMWLDGKEFKYIHEVGTMNIFFVINDTVLTPATNGCILKGITRDGFLHILKDEGYTVEERDITIDEIMNAGKNGSLKEIFGAGTAAVVSSVNKLAYKDDTIELDPSTYKVAPFLKKYIEGLRDGSVTDTRGWIVPVKSHEFVLA